MVYLRLVTSIFLALTLFVITSCSSTPKIQNSTKTPVNNNQQNQAVNGNNLQQLPPPEPNSSQNSISTNSNVTKNNTKPTPINYGLIKDKYGINKKFILLLDKKLQPTSYMKRDTILFMPKTKTQKQVYNGKFFDRDEPILMSHLDLKESIDAYANKFFPSFNKVGKLTIVKKLNVNQLKAYGAYLNANLIIMKKFEEPDIHEFVHEVLFLNGNIRDVEDNYWYRSIKEAEVVDNKDLLALNNYTLLAGRDESGKAKYVNLDAVVVNLTSYNVKQVIDETIKNLNTITPILNKWQAKLDNKYVKKTKKMEFYKTAYLPKDSYTPDMYTEIAKEISTKLSENEVFAIYALQKDLISERVNKVIGTWVDIETGQIFNIRMQKQKLQLGDENNPLATGSKTSEKNSETTTVEEITYNGYAILDRPIQQLKNNPNLNWINNDLKFSFNLKKGGDGYYIDDSKMVNSAKFNLQSARGLIIVKLPNGEYKYLAPYIPNILPELQQYLYYDLAKNAKENHVDQDNIYAFKKYIQHTQKPSGYLIYPGITIGVIIIFLFFAV